MKLHFSFGLVTALVLFGSNCTVSNPLYSGNTGNPDLSASPDGGINQFDLSHSTVDLATHPSCVQSDRSCAQSGDEASLSCVLGQLAPDRTCLDSTCTDGYCNPPDQQSGSQIGADCAQNGDPNDVSCQFAPGVGLACQPFVTDPQNGGVEWFCGTAVGQGNSAAACTKGSDCRSGFCGTNGFCFRACGSDNDCPVNMMSGKRYHCDKVGITVEGVQVNEFRSCVP